MPISAQLIPYPEAVEIIGHRLYPSEWGAGPNESKMREVAQRCLFNNARAGHIKSVLVVTETGVTRPFDSETWGEIEKAWGTKTSDLVVTTGEPPVWFRPKTGEAGFGRVDRRSVREVMHFLADEIDGPIARYAAADVPMPLPDSPVLPIWEIAGASVAQRVGELNLTSAEKATRLQDNIAVAIVGAIVRGNGPGSTGEGLYYSDGLPIGTDMFDARGKPGPLLNKLTKLINESDRGALVEYAKAIYIGRQCYLDWAEEDSEREARFWQKAKAEDWTTSGLTKTERRNRLIQTEGVRIREVLRKEGGGKINKSQVVAELAKLTQFADIDPGTLAKNYRHTLQRRTRRS